jgi:pimeloyl-ACP methyl ester carboxylesterase
MGTGGSEFLTIRPWLERRYTVIAPDLRGYGKSEPKPRTYGVDFYEQDARDMAALLHHLEMTDAAVMGYSDGGEVALWLGLLAPVRRIITWGATGHFSDTIRPAVLSMLSHSWRTPQIDRLHGREYIPEMTQRWVNAMLQIIERGGDVTYSHAADIPCPVLMLLGDRDALNPVAQASSMVKALPNGKLSIYPRTGHAVHAERPRRFKREVLRFLARG